MDLQLFQFNDTKIRSVFIDGEPWFVASDVCEVLGLDAYEAVKGKKNRQFSDGLDDDEYRDVPDIVDTIGRKQPAIVVSESGVYHLIFKSRKPEARAFRKWVTSEVLPSIRKTGMYVLTARSVVAHGLQLSARQTELWPSKFIQEVEGGLGIPIAEARHRIRAAQLFAPDDPLLAYFEAPALRILTAMSTPASVLEMAKQRARERQYVNSRVMKAMAKQARAKEITPEEKLLKDRLKGQRKHFSNLQAMALPDNLDSIDRMLGQFQLLKGDIV
jgi:prophage antirepressor-like protein